MYFQMISSVNRDETSVAQLIGSSSLNAGSIIMVREYGHRIY